MQAETPAALFVFDCHRMAHGGRSEIRISGPVHIGTLHRTGRVLRVVREVVGEVTDRDVEFVPFNSSKYCNDSFDGKLGAWESSNQ